MSGFYPADPANMGGGGSGMPVAPSNEASIALGGNAWQLMSITGANRAFLFDTSTVAGDPGAGRVRLNNAVPASATEIYISNLTTSGIPFGSLLKQLRAGDYGVINDFNTQTNALLYRITVAPVDNGTWFSAQIQSEGAGGAFTNNMVVSTDVYPLASPALRNDRTTTVEYANVALPVLPTTIATGVDPALFANDVDITVSFQFSGGGNTYALFGQTTAVALVANPLVRITRTGEANGVAGDATMAYWYDNGTNQIQVALDFDGGGKTAVSLTVTSGFNTPVPV